MKAVWYEKTGAAEVLCFGEMEMPSPAAGEVLVRVCASGVNPSDVKIRAGARGAMAFLRQIPHSDGAGIIEAVGEGVSASRMGSGCGFGTPPLVGRMAPVRNISPCRKNKPSPCTRKLNFCLALVLACR